MSTTEALDSHHRRQNWRKVVATIGSSCIFNASKSWYCWSYTWKGSALFFTSVDCHIFQSSSTEYSYEAWTQESHNSRLGKGLNNSLLWRLWDSSWFVCKIRRQIMKLYGAFIVYWQLLDHWRKGHQGQRGMPDKKQSAQLRQKPRNLVSVTSLSLLHPSWEALGL